MKQSILFLLAALVAVTVRGGLEQQLPAEPTDVPAQIVANAVTPPLAQPEAMPVVAENVAVAPKADAVEPIVIEYVEADMQSVLRSLAAKANANLILGDEVTGKVTVHLEGITYEEAMKLIVESKGYAYVKDKNVVKVKSRESLEVEPVEVKIHTLNYAKADDVKRTLEPVMSKQGKIQVDARSNTLVLSDTISSLAKLIPLIQSLDTQTPQVLIEAKFVETTKNPKKDLGINWSGTLLNHELTAGSDAVVDADTGKPVSGFQLAKDLSGGPWMPSTALLDGGQAKLVFSFLNSDSDSELLANPRIVTTDNGKAKITITRQVPIPQFSFNEQTAAFVINGFEYKDIGLVLNVTPRINKDAFITLEVAPEASSSSANQTFQGGGAAFEIPIVDTRQAATTVLIKSGNTLAIGGLMRQDVTDKYTKVPVMGDVPLLGALFRSKSLEKIKRNLLIFLTPVIVRPEEQTGYEKYADGFPPEEIYTNDKWQPKENAKPREVLKWGAKPAAKSTAQNFRSK